MSQKRGDPIGLWVAGGSNGSTGLQGYIPPSQRSLRPIFHRLSTVDPSGEAEIHTHLEQLAIHLPRKSIVIVVSDWMEEPQLWGPKLEALTAVGHDVRCLQLYSKVEWELSLPESVQVYSAEHQDHIPLDTPAMKEVWLGAVDQYRTEVEQWAGRARAIWVQAAVEDELLPPLIRLVRGRV